MPSGKQSKRRRAVQAAAPVHSAARKRQASPRVLAIAGALVALALAAVVLSVAFSRDDSKDAAEPVRGVGETQRLLEGIPQSGNVLGKSTSPVTIYEYVDAQCPFCKEFETQAMPTLIERYVRTGKAKVELRPIAFIGPDSERGRAALIAGAAQNKMFNVAQLLFLNQGAENSGWLSNGFVERVAASIPGLDGLRFLEDRNASSVAGKATEFDTEASTDGVTSTPTILVAKTGQEAKPVSLASPTDAESVARAIDAALG